MHLWYHRELDASLARAWIAGKITDTVSFEH